MSRIPRGDPLTEPQAPILMHWPRGGGVGGASHAVVLAGEISGRVGVGQRW